MATRNTMFIYTSSDEERDLVYEIVQRDDLEVNRKCSCMLVIQQKSYSSITPFTRVSSGVLFIDRFTDRGYEYLGRYGGHPEGEVLLARSLEDVPEEVRNDLDMSWMARFRRSRKLR